MQRIVNSAGISSQKITVVVQPLAPHQAIGRPERDDFPLLKGKERMLEARFLDNRGHAFTDAFSSTSRSVADFLSLNLHDRFQVSWFVAAMNAILRGVGLVNGTVHCRDKEPGECAADIVEHLKTNYKGIRNVTLIGYQPAMGHRLCQDYNLSILDLDPDNIDQERAGTVVLDGRNGFPRQATECDLALATGSSLTNGTIQKILQNFPHDKLVFYGVTIAAAAHFLELNRFCPRSH